MPELCCLKYLLEISLLGICSTKYDLPIAQLNHSIEAKPPVPVKQLLKKLINIQFLCVGASFAACKLFQVIRNIKNENEKLLMNFWHICKNSAKLHQSVVKCNLEP